jgi:hypothetical protein
MKAFIISMLKEGDQISCGRVLSLLSLIIGAVIAILGLYLDKDLNALSVLVGVFVGSGMLGKVGQKFAERE